MRESSRRGRTLRYAAVGGVLGALIVLCCFVAATLTGGTHWSFVVLLALLLGAAVGAGFAPLFSLARDDGEDADAILGRAVSGGRADTSTEGAQANDHARGADAGS
jgi:hypothetical protein